MVTHWLTVIVRDENHIGIPDIPIRISGVFSGYTGPNGGFDYEIVHGETREVRALQITGYTCVTCTKNVTVNDDVLVHLTMKTSLTPTYKNIPQEVVDVMPPGTTDIVALNIKRLSIFGKDISDIPKAKGMVPWIIEKAGDIITYKGLVGWNCLGVEIVELSSGEIILPIFMRRV